MTRKSIGGLLPVLAGLLLATLVQAAAEPVRAITHLAGAVYRFQNDGHFSVFMVTEEGVIATDPISPDAAAWLNNEIQTRFGQPVKYVIYSHDHWDHVSGAAAFPDATIIAHANAVPHIAASDQPIEAPDITFTTEMSLKLGGREVRLYYFGVSHSDNLIYMLFPEEKILFGVDAIAVNRLPFRDFAGVDVDGLIGSIATLEQLDVAIVAPGHGAVGTLADLTAHRVYIETLKERVAEQLRKGRSLAQIEAAVTMPEYSAWESYDAWQGLNVEGMVRFLSAQ
ncbi:MAG: MBL fold metallo-hydrolase [Pseudomonadales bacterium]|nr:MBL fold metallo-hydrolase [Pseudomonadales bacterium]